MKRTQKWSKRPSKPLFDCHNGQKHKKLFFLAPERARTVLNAFLECMYFQNPNPSNPNSKYYFEFGLDGRTDAVHNSVNSYANYVGYRNYLGYANVNVTELFSLYTVVTNLGITRNSAFLA